MKQTRLSQRGGFTLMEILLVVVIIGMLVGVAAVKLGPQIGRAKETAARDQIHAYKMALGTYELDTGVLPTTEQGLQALLTSPGGSTPTTNWKGPYLDPPVLRPDPWGRPYIYKNPGVKLPTGYDLYSTGPGGVDGGDDNIGNWQ